MVEPRFKPGDEVFCDGLGWGCGRVLEVNGAYLMRVDFGPNGIRPLAITEHWRLATAEDKQSQLLPEPEPEPMGEPEELTLAGLEAAVAQWEQSVRYFEAGFDCTEEYTHDLFDRYCLHGVLNGFARLGLAVPDAIKARIAAADKRFVELTVEVEYSVWGRAEHYDKETFWYYYRWLIK
jgi:hypothetical protein